MPINLPTVHRIYIGARNIKSHKFMPGDDARINDTLEKYLSGWTITTSLGYWDGVQEETRILTVIETPENKKPYGRGLESAIPEIASFLHQYAIMWESHGTAAIVPTKTVKPNPPVLDITVLKKPKIKKVTPIPQITAGK